MSERYITSREACKILCVSANTLRKWASDGRVRFIRTAGNQRRYSLDSVRSLVTPSALLAGYILDRPDDTHEQKKQREKFIHTLVSDTAFGTNQMIVYRDNAYVHDLIDRPALKSIIGAAMNKKVVLYINEPDDIAVIGYKLIESVIEFNGGRIICLGERNSSEKELSKWMIKNRV